MQVKATRGVCVGVGQNMKAGEVRDLDKETASYLKAIGAVEDAPAERPSTSAPDSGRNK
jgi:hypothetical protein